ncbi:MAG: TVP38/TMEM64 family protein [Candidatus Omnitrophica bacterium]|nr:TVP38/TMEM64 family protein [Candidatus Omnitrophota bacterium]
MGFMDKRSSWIKFAALLFLLIAAAGLAYANGLRFSDMRPERVQAFIRSFGWWSWVVFILIYAQPIVPLPASIILMSAGLAFGIWGGFLIGWLAASFRACTQFLLARTLGRQAIESLLRGRLSLLDEKIGRQGFQTVFWIRLIPNVPFDLQNLGLGLSRVTFWPFTFATLLGLVPACMLWACLGNSLIDPRGIRNIVIIFIGLVILWVAPRWVRNRRMRWNPVGDKMGNNAPIEAVVRRSPFDSAQPFDKSSGLSPEHSGSPRAEPVAPTSSSLDSASPRSGRPRARAHGHCIPSEVEGRSP